MFKDVITERSYSGYVTRAARQADTADKINDDITVNSLIEIIGDAFASENMFAIRYVEWAGAKWKIPNVEPQHPRLLLTLGGVYNGPTPVVP